VLQLIKFLLKHGGLVFRNLFVSQDDLKPCHVIPVWAKSNIEAVKYYKHIFRLIARKMGRPGKIRGLEPAKGQGADTTSVSL